MGTEGGFWGWEGDSGEGLALGATPQPLCAPPRSSLQVISEDSMQRLLTACFRSVFMLPPKEKLSARNFVMVGAAPPPRAPPHAGCVCGGPRGPSQGLTRWFPPPTDDARHGQHAAAAAAQPAHHQLPLQAAEHREGLARAGGASPHLGGVSSPGEGSPHLGRLSSPGGGLITWGGVSLSGGFSSPGGGRITPGGFSSS